MAKHYLQLSNVLQQLLYDHRMNAYELARAVGLPAPTVHRLVSGKSTRPYKSSLQPIADYFSISMEQLLGEEPLSNYQELPKQSPFPAESRVIEIPLIEWGYLNQPNARATSQQTVIATSDLSIHCFAIIMNDSSMEPQFSRGSVLIIDPNKQQPRDRHFILVQLADSNIVVFRQVLIDADYKFLKPLNPDLSAFKMRLLEQDDKILGSLVEARQTY